MKKKKNIAQLYTLQYYYFFFTFCWGISKKRKWTLLNTPFAFIPVQSIFPLNIYIYTYLCMCIRYIYMQKYVYSRRGEYRTTCGRSFKSYCVVWGKRLKAIWDTRFELKIFLQNNVYLRYFYISFFSLFLFLFVIPADTTHSHNLMQIISFVIIIYFEIFT